MAIGECTLTGTWQRPDGEDTTGTVIITPTYPVFDPTNDIEIPQIPIVATITSNAISVSNVPVLSEVAEGYTYTVTEILDGTQTADGRPASPRRYVIVIPADGAGNSYELADIATATPPAAPAGVTQAQLTAATPDASATVKGLVELATAAEVATGTDTTRAVTPAGAAGSYVSGRVVATAALESDTASITFSSIPQTFETLVLELRSRTNAAANNDSVIVTFNGDTTNANYDRELVVFSASSSTPAYNSSTRLAITTLGDTAPTDTFGECEMRVPHYSGNAVKVAKSQNIQGSTTSVLQFSLGVTRWKTSAPITTILLQPNVGALFKAGTVATLRAFGGAIPTDPY